MHNTINIKNIDSILAFLLLLSGMGTFFFAAIMNIIGWAEEGPRWSTLLSAYTALLALISVLVFLANCSRIRLSRTSLAYGGAIGVMCIGFMLTSQHAQGAARYFLLFLSTAIPGFLAGLILCDRRFRKHVWKYVDVLMLVLTLSLALFLALPNHSEGYAIDYQTASYMGALAFGFNLSMLLKGSDFVRFRLFSTRGWRIITVVLAAFQAIGTLLTGGRGGALLVAMYSVVVVAILMKRGMGVKKLAYLALILIASLAVVNYILDNQNQAGIARILSGRDNRSSVYNLAWTAFLNNPIVGYGPYGFFAEMKGIEYPHNIVLELLLTYGIVGLFFEVCLVVILCVHIQKQGIRGIPSWLTVLGLYSIARLFFSSTFLSFTPFWFVLGFLCNYSCEGHITHKTEIADGDHTDPEGVLLKEDDG